MRRQPKDTFRPRNWLEIVMTVFVVIMVCMLIILSFSSVYKQIDIKRSRLTVEITRLENNLNDSYKPFFNISHTLQSSFESGEPADTGVTGEIEYDEDAGLSYLSWETDGFAGTLVSAEDLRAASGAVKEEIARAVRAIQPVEGAVSPEHYFVSRQGYVVYFSRIGKDVFLDGDGNALPIAEAVKDTMELVMARSQAQPQPEEPPGDPAEAPSGNPPETPPGDQLSDPGMTGVSPGMATATTPIYENAFGDGRVVTYLEPVSANGETMGVLCFDIRLSELDEYMSHISSGLGMVCLLSGDNEMLACYAMNESMFDGTGFDESAQTLLEELNLSSAELDALGGSPNSTLWRGTRAVIVVPVMYADMHILYTVELFALLSESNMLLWIAMGALTMAIIIVLIVSLFKSRRKILKSNIRLQENIRKLDFLSHYDRLTGLLTSESVIEKINHFIRLTPVIIMMLDVDDFKDVNDKYLHTFGNVVLKRIASIIREYMPGNAYAGRFGGDEFVCVLLDSTPEQAIDIAENIRAGVTGLKFREHDVVITVSIGIARSQNKETKDVLERADKFMYQAKDKGKNRWVYEED